MECTISATGVLTVSESVSPRGLLFWNRTNTTVVYSRWTLRTHSSQSDDIEHIALARHAQAEHMNRTPFDVVLAIIEDSDYLLAPHDIHDEQQAPENDY